MAALLWLLRPFAVLFLRFGAVTGLLGAAAADLAERRIPNRLVLVVLAAGVTLRLLANPTDLWLSTAGGAVLFLALGVIAHGGFIGGGDVKLIAAASFLVPAHHIFPLLGHIALAGGVLSLVYLAARTTLRSGTPVPANTGTWGAETPDPAHTGAPRLTRWVRDERSRILGREPMPYGVAIFLGVTYCLLVEVIP
jgi:prepilin peptidase CpaA